MVELECMQGLLRSSQQRRQPRKGCSAGHNVKATSFEERTLFSGDKQGTAVKLPAEARRRLATAAWGSQCAGDDKRSTDKLDDREAVLWPARPVGA
ncbi:hypothetical protein CCHR01_14903 [Colletotrichum chrysophilum]|uniref:Uncharacterized protein n=1 Tax=Colletotrichum chrysophilum TaxID=1836956 RepID=A0AAD9A9B3_9PEZI|nr:hypothetical protein CCHR01_14903 [Colletotrichum chrysophilum]